MIKDPCGVAGASKPSVQKGVASSLVESSANERPSPRCRTLCSPRIHPSAPVNHCIDGELIIDIRVNSGQEAAFLQHSRDIQESFERTAIHYCSAQVVAVVLSSSAHVVQYSTLGQSFLKKTAAICIRDGKLRCSNSMCQGRFSEAISKAIHTGKTTNLLVHSVEHPNQRFSMSLVPLSEPSADNAELCTELRARVVCLIARLDQRRFATAQQLMDIFGLSTSEARLARAVCHGESLGQYAVHNGLKMPTVRTQMRSVFAKTGSERQSTLVRLLSAIPVVR